MKLTQGSANSRKVKSRRGTLLLSGTPSVRSLILRPPSPQVNGSSTWPPLCRSAAADHRWSAAILVGEMAQSLAAANTLRCSACSCLPELVHRLVANDRQATVAIGVEGRRGPLILPFLFIRMT